MSFFSKILKYFLNFIKKFCDFSSIHGLNHLADKKKHSIEKFLWAILVISAAYGATELSLVTLTRYYENPTVISIERDRFSWNTSFPSATICPHFKFNNKSLDEYVEKSNAKNKTKFKQFLSSLAEASYYNFESIVDYPHNVLPNQYMDVLLQIKFNFNPAVSNSGTNSKSYGIEETITEMGICHSFNSKLAIYNNPRYWKEGKWILVEGNETFHVNPLDGEVFANLINMSTGFDIYIHGPLETVDIASKKIRSENEYFLQLYLNGITLFSSKKTKSLSIYQRKCRFFDESNLKHSPAYSYVLCRMECRISLSKKLCGCIPHFYRPLANEKVCDVPGLHCLAKHKERLILLEGECSCLSNCDEVNFYLEDSDTRQWFLGSNLQWGLKHYPKMRLRRDVIFGFTELLVYIGGMAGLFLGCSVLSFIEIIYFVTFRLFCSYYISRK